MVVVSWGFLCSLLCTEKQQVPGLQYLELWQHVSTIHSSSNAIDGLTFIELLWQRLVVEGIADHLFTVYMRMWVKIKCIPHCMLLKLSFGPL
jgi:hypothetical protein